MADKNGQPDEAKSVSPSSDYDHLVDLCEHGMLYEAEEWLRAGNSSTRPEGHRKCAIYCATTRGFHSLVKLLLQYHCTKTQMLNSLEEAAENGDLEICKLLVEAGAPVAELSHHYLYEVIRRPLIEYLLDHGLDLSRNNGLAYLLVHRRVKPLLGLFLQNRKRFPEWEEQAAIALCEFIRSKDKKWISLMIWAGADPFLPVHDLSDIKYEPEDDEWKETAVRCAAWADDLEIVKMLKINPTPEQASEILFAIWSSPTKSMVEDFISAGADINTYTDEEGSLLHKALHSFSVRDDYWTPRTTSEEEVELIALLISMGAKWHLPDGKYNLNGLRLRMYKQEGDHVVEIIRLLCAGECCDIARLKEFVYKPKMQGWVRQYDSKLYEHLRISP